MNNFFTSEEHDFLSHYYFITSIYVGILIMAGILFIQIRTIVLTIATIFLIFPIIKILFERWL